MGSEQQLQALLIEYESMRSQGLEMTTQVRTILMVGLSAITFMLIYGWSKKVDEILFCLPVVALLVLQLLLWSDTLGVALAGYEAALTERINELVGQKVMIWEKHISMTFASQGAVFLGTHAAIFFVCLAAGAYGLWNTYQVYSKITFSLLFLIVLVLFILMILSVIDLANAYNKAYQLAISELNK